MSGGGGASGAISYAAYIETYHTQILSDGATPAFDLSVVEVTNNMLAAANPFTGINAYDPDADISDIAIRLETFSDLVDDISETVDWAAFESQALSLVDDFIPTDASLDTRIELIESSAEKTLARSYNRINAAYFSINGVIGTSLPTALAILESEHIRGISAARSDLEVATRTQRAQLLSSAIQQMITMQQTKFSTGMQLTDEQRLVAMQIIAARTDEIKNNTALNIDEVNWDMNILTMASAHLGAMQGGLASTPNKGMTTAQSVLGGALGGASLAISAGASFGGGGAAVVGGIGGPHMAVSALGGPLGIALGAGIGGLLGLLAG